MNVLIVDDDRLMLEAISHSLKAEGFNVSVAEDGFKALSKIDTEIFDLIISDIMMPNLSGIGFLGMVRQIHHDKIPVIVMSSLNKVDNILPALDLKVIDFIVKPFNPEELTNRVKSIKNRLSI